MFGIICQEDLPGHSLFLNFKLALKNYFACEFTNVKSVYDLNGLTTLFIVDEHFGPHVDIWKNLYFIDTANRQNIKVVVFNFEKIYSSQFPWNVDHQNTLKKFNNLIQFVTDIDDAKILNSNVINKQFLSKDTVLVNIKEKNNKVVFIGQVNQWYPTRQKIINEFKSLNIPFDVIVTDRKLSYNEFLEKLNEYKFVLNPLGTGNFLNLRFYEALKLGCIPIQQVTSSMKSFYTKELSHCISFENISDLKNLDINYRQMDYYLEDYFTDINLKNY